MKKNSIITVITVVFITLVMIVACVTIPLTSRGGEEESVSEDSPVSLSADRTNILVGGCDRTSGLTDVIIILSIDEKSGAASLMQIPRDTYAEYTTGSYKKLNGAYGALGAQGLCEFLSESLGIRIDSYLIMAPDALVEIVDALGGVEIYLEEPMRYSDPAQGLYISLDAGRQTLDGKRAEQFIRYRSGYADGDLGRLDAQKDFLCGLLAAVRKNTDPITMVRLAATLVGKTDTNITPAEGIRLAEAVLSFDTARLSLMTAPGDAVVAESSGASYYSLSGRAMDEVLRKYFGGSSGFDPRGVYLNERYVSFRAVYEGYSDYRVYSVKNIQSQNNY